MTLETDRIETQMGDVDLVEQEPIPFGVLEIYTSPHKGKPMEQHDSIFAFAHKGLQGDRYNMDIISTEIAHYVNHRIDNAQRNVTIISRKGVSNANDELEKNGGVRIKLSETRRNLVVEIDPEVLNALAETQGEFSIGGVRMKAVELAKPCVIPPTFLGRPEDGPAFVKAYLQSGGIRAEILNDGEISKGDLMVLPQLATSQP